MCAQHMSRRDLNTLIDAALTTFTGSLFQSTLHTLYSQMPTSLVLFDIGYWLIAHFEGIE